MAIIITEQEKIKDAILKDYGLTTQFLHKIDKNALDEDCERHAAEYDKVSEALCFLEDARDRAKYNLDEIEALLSLEALSASTKDGGKPLSDKKIEMSVISDERYKAAVTLYLDLKYKAKLIEKLIYSLDKKTHELGNLCSLYIGGYFAKIAGDHVVVKEQQSKQMREFISEKRKTFNTEKSELGGLK